MVIVVLVGGRASFVALLRDYSAGVVVEIENAIVFARRRAFPQQNVWVSSYPLGYSDLDVSSWPAEIHLTKVKLVGSLTLKSYCI